MSGRSRLGPDPSVSIGDLEKKIFEVTERQGCKDLAKLIHSKVKQTWRTAPDSDWLGCDGLADLLSSLFSLHRNGVLQSSKLKKAVLKLQTEKGRLNFTKNHDSDWVDQIDDQVRITAQQYRSLKQDQVKYKRLVKKCSVQEKKNVDMVLSFLQLAKMEQVEENDGTMVAATKPEVAMPKPKVGAEIFSKVLKREASDPASPSLETRGVKLKLSLEDGNAASSSWERPLPSQVQPFELAGVLGLEQDEANELKAWMEQSCVGEKKRKEKKKKGMKKPGASETKLSPKAKAKSAATPKKKETKAAVTVSPKKQQVYKTTFLHRATSSSWAKARLRALKEGKDEEEAKAAGRAAADKVRQDIKDGLLKEQ